MKRLEKKVDDSQKRLLLIGDTWAKAVRGTRPRIEFARHVFGVAPQGADLETQTLKRYTKLLEGRFGDYIEQSRRAGMLSLNLAVFASLASGGLEDERPVDELPPEQQALTKLSWEGHQRYEVEAGTMMSHARALHTIIAGGNRDEREQAIYAIEAALKEHEDSPVPEAGMDARVQAGLREVINNRLRLAGNLMDALRLDFAYLAAGGDIASTALRQNGHLLEMASEYHKACDADIAYARTLGGFTPPQSRLN